MAQVEVSSSGALGLKVGDWVEVRSREEILATLDESGRLENLPFMTEMFQYCGRRFQVYKRADKTCDYIEGWSVRRMTDSVFLDGLRCDGGGHGGCEASCLIFWKEQWLKRADSNLVSGDSLRSTAAVSANGHHRTEEQVRAACQTVNSDGEIVYFCQGTDVPKYSSFMKWWDPRQWVRDIRSGNLKTGLAGDSKEERRLEVVLALVAIVRTTIIFLFNRRQQKRYGARGAQYPLIVGSQDKTPVEILDLQPGELVQVRTKEEIMATINKDQRNRGLWFDSEMLPYCGGIYRVLRRVSRIVDEKTGKIIKMKHPCLILEGVFCRSDYHQLCPRAIYSYWRESWLRRASVEVPSGSQMEREVGSCPSR